MIKSIFNDRLMNDLKELNKRSILYCFLVHLLGIIIYIHILFT